MNDFLKVTDQLISMSLVKEGAMDLYAHHRWEDESPMAARMENRVDRLAQKALLARKNGFVASGKEHYLPPLYCPTQALQDNLRAGVESPATHTYSFRPL